MNIGDNVRRLRGLMPTGVEMVAVSKFHPVSMIKEAYEAGQRKFGESRVQEFLEKREELPEDIEWHFIGHLQTNKVKQIIGKVSLIESVDSVKLLSLIDQESGKAGVTSPVLLQVHVAQEETKFGFYPEELRSFFREGVYKDFKNTVILGLMGMASNTEDISRIRKDFSEIRKLYDEIAENKEYLLPEFRYVSMGMSGDWEIAVEEGANIVRIGSAIFGDRN